MAAHVKLLWLVLFVHTLAGCTLAAPEEPHVRSNWAFSKDAQGREVAQFYNDGGILLYEWRQLDGKQDGPQKCYYGSGHLKSYDSYKEGKLNGQSWDWDESGRVTCVREYLNGEEHGTTRLWYEDGTLASKQQWVHGVKQGLCYERLRPPPSPMTFTEEKWQTGILRGKKIVELPNEPPPQFVEQE